MIILLRILLFTLCIHSSISFATEISLTPSQPVQIQANYEVLDNTYVQMEWSADTTATLTILKTLGRLFDLIQEEYYSLLNWKTYSRRSNLEIEKYKRLDHFGRWINDPNDDTCYNTRALVLIRDSDKEVTFSDTNKCNVVTGRWHDPYTDDTFTAREEIQIDHLVPLKNAYMSGAYKWNFKARCLYANYMGNDFHLKSVNASQNMKKGDRTPEKYMPPNPEYSCRYLKNWLVTKFLWNLKMSVGEAEAIAQAMRDNRCNRYNFKISAREIMKQASFANDNIDLCDAIAPATAN